MTVQAAPSNNRRLIAATLAEYGASALPIAPQLRRLFSQPEEMLNWLERTTSPLKSTLVFWGRSPLLCGDHPVDNFGLLRAMWGEGRTAACAIQVCLARLYQPDWRLYQYSRGQLFRHQFAVAWAAGLIARYCRVDEDVAFLCGAVHDIGYIALDRLARSRFAEVLEQLDEYRATTSIEREQYGCDHAQVGAELLRRWGASELVCDVVCCHHCPGLAATLESRRLAGVVALANFLVSRMGRSALGVHNLRPPTDEILMSLGLGYRALSELVNELVRILPESDQLAA